MDAGDHNGQEQTQPQIGAVLEQKRREKGLSLKDVEQATKIRTRYLEGLEREDYGVLPDAVYVQGFLKTYANFLGLDGEQLSRELKDRRAPRRERQLVGEGFRASDFEQPLITPGDLAGAGRRRLPGTAVLTVALAVLVLAAAVGGLYLIGSRSAWGPGEEPQAQKETPAEPEPSPAVLESTTEPTAETPTTTPTTTSTAETTTGTTVRVTLRVTNSASFLLVQTDGSVVYNQVAQPGFSQTFEARNALTVSTGNAGAVGVEVNGRDMGAFGKPGEVTSRTFTPQGG